MSVASRVLDGDAFFRLGIKGRRDWLRDLKPDDVIAVTSKDNQISMDDQLGCQFKSNKIIIRAPGAPMPVMAPPIAPLSFAPIFSAPLDLDDLVAATHPLKELEATW
jgi:hypothetical protein